MRRSSKRWAGWPRAWPTRSTPPHNSSQTGCNSPAKRSAACWGFKGSIPSLRQPAPRRDRSSKQTQAIAQAEREADFEYLKSEAPAAFERSLAGLARVSRIVRALTRFAHAEQTERSPADLNRALQDTLTVAHAELVKVAEIESDLGDIPHVICHVGDLNQVFLSLLMNSVEAIAAVSRVSGNRGTIRVATSCSDDVVSIVIADNGGGMSGEVKRRIFEPFFTTKEIGRSTGQGLALARAIVVDQHGGTLNFESDEGKGATFFIRLPVYPPSKGG